MQVSRGSAARRASVAFAALVLGASVGCSGGDGSSPPGSTGDGDDGGQGSSQQPAGDGAGGSSSSTDASTPPGTGHDSDAGGGGGNDGGGGGGNGSTPDDSAAHDSGGLTDSSTASTADASGHPDASAVADAAAAGDAAATEAAWLDPMNAARTAVGEAPLVWNPIAAQVALNYAMQCDYQHNPNRNSDYASLGGGSTGLGENIAAGAPTQTVASAVTSWVSEESSYDHATNTCASGQDCGHYTQIVWSTTTAVGCAKVSCTTGSPFGSFGGGKWDYSVCDFSPPGNIVGASPY